MKIKVLPAGDKLVVNIAALDAHVVRYIGRRLDPEARWYVATGEVEELDYHPDYLTALRNGDLLPGDAATAHLIQQTSLYSFLPYSKPSKLSKE